MATATATRVPTLTPTTAALSAATCRELLAPLYAGRHLHHDASNTGARSNPWLRWHVLWLVNRPGGRTEQVLGQGSTKLAALRQAAERVRVFGWERVLADW